MSDNQEHIPHPSNALRVGDIARITVVGEGFEGYGAVVGDIVRIGYVAQSGPGYDAKRLSDNKPVTFEAGELYKGDVWPASLQKAFNKVYHHAVNVLAGRVAKKPHGTCVYRGGGECGTLQCFVGALVPDHVYTDGIEGCTLSDFLEPEGKMGILVGILTVEGYGDKETLEFLRRVQRMHDAGVPLPTRLGDKDGAPAVLQRVRYEALTAGRRLYFWKRSLTRFAKRHGLTIPGA